MENNEKTNETETTTVENLEITETGKKLSKREIALVVTAGLALGLVGLCLSPKTAKGEKVYNDIKNFFKITASEETNNNQTEGYSAEDYANMSVKYSQEELNEMTFEELNDVYTEYNATLQQDVFNLLESTQNMMNEETLPSIKLDSDEEKQLYLYASEIISTYIIVNAKYYSSEDLVKIFGNSGLLSDEYINQKYVQARQEMNITEVMCLYYSRATQRSGIANLFMNEDDKKLVEQFEDMVIEYNNATTDNRATLELDIIKFLNDLTDDTKVFENPGAVSYVLKVGASFATTNRFIDDDTYHKLYKTNESVTCDTLISLVENAEALARIELGTEPTGIYKVVTSPADPRAMDDKNVRDLVGNLDRNIAWGNYEQSNIKRENNYSDSYYSETIRKGITREESVNYFSEGQVQQVEENARRENTKENQQAESDKNDYQLGHNNGYALAYYNASTNGTMISTSTSGSAKYQEGYSNGVVSGYNDGLAEYRAKQQIINNPPQQEIIEQPVAPAIPEQQQPQQQPEQQPQTPPQQPETTAPVVVEQPVTVPVAPDTSAGEEIDPDFVGTSSKIIEYEITYLGYDGTEKTLDDYNGNKPFVRHL